MMKLLIKQRVFSWTDTYDVYDESEMPKYYVKAEFFTLGHVIHVYDRFDREVGCIREKLLTFMPCFRIEANGNEIGEIHKRFTFFSNNYDIDFNGWNVEGDFLGWDYSITDPSGKNVVNISKELFHWGDTYTLTFANPSDELVGLLTVIAIDAANCKNN